MADLKEELIKVYREQQYKYTYYIIALCVAAIGFVVTQTIGKPIKYIQIPLGGAVAAWCISIFCGLRFIQYQIAGLYNNVEYLKIQDGTSEMIAYNKGLIPQALNMMREILEKNGNKASKLANWQDWCFYLGIFLFIVWHILEMTQTAPAC